LIKSPKSATLRVIPAGKGRNLANIDAQYSSSAIRGKQNGHFVHFGNHGGNDRRGQQQINKPENQPFWGVELRRMGKNSRGGWQSSGARIINWRGTGWGNHPLTVCTRHLMIRVLGSGKIGSEKKLCGQRELEKLCEDKYSLKNAGSAKGTNPLVEKLVHG